MNHPDLLSAIQTKPDFLLASIAAGQAQSKEGRRRDVLFYSGSKVARYDWWEDEWYDLSFSMDGADLSALSAGAPVLNSHSQWTAMDVIGKVESAKKGERGYEASLAFSEADDVTPIWQRIEEGTLSNVSMGVQIKLLKDVTEKGDSRRHLMALDWKPFEISVVPIGADPGAKFLASDPRFERMRNLSAKPAAADDAEQRNAQHRLKLLQSRYRALGF